MDKKKSLNPMPDCQGGPSHLGERPVVGAQCGGSELGRLRAALSALKRFGPVAAVAAVMLVVFAMGWHGEITLENVVALHDRFHNVLAEHSVLSVLAYIVIYVLAVALSVPCGLVLTLAGGFLFGWLVGGFAAVIGATIGATIIFLIAKSTIGHTLAESAGPWLEKLRAGFEKEGLSYMLFLRLVPFPFWVINLAPAVLGVPLRTFLIGTFLGIIPGTLTFAYFGDTLDRVVREAKTSFDACVAKGAANCKLSIGLEQLPIKQIFVALALLGLIVLIPAALKKWRTTHAAAK
jgi:uncharacterized membrane protein YdjX (TVP38/TMEM64 family)